MIGFELSGTYVPQIGLNTSLGINAIGDGNSLSDVHSAFSQSDGVVWSGQKGSGSWDGSAWNCSVSGYLRTNATGYVKASGSLKMYTKDGKPQVAFSLSGPGASYSVDTGTLPPDQSQVKGTIATPHGPAAA